MSIRYLDQVGVLYARGDFYRSGRPSGRPLPAVDRKNAPIAIVLHPQFGGTMNNKIVYDLFYMFQKRNFTTLRFNFRSIGRSQGEFDHGTGELSDAAAALDWIQSLHPIRRAALGGGLFVRRVDRHAAATAARDRWVHPWPRSPTPTTSRSLRPARLPG